jgi:hypothetical protein
MSLGFRERQMKYNYIKDLKPGIGIYGYAEADNYIIGLIICFRSNWQHWSVVD